MTRDIRERMTEIEIEVGGLQVFLDTYKRTIQTGDLNLIIHMLANSVEALLTSRVTDLQRELQDLQKQWGNRKPRPVTIDLEATDIIHHEHPV